MKTINPFGNTSGKSCGNDLCPSGNQQGMLADLSSSSPGPPRAAADAHLNLNREHMMQALNTGVYERFGCMSPSPSCLRNIDTVVSSAGLGHEHFLASESPGPAWTTGQFGAPPLDGVFEAPSDQAMMAFDGASANLLDLLVNHLLSANDEANDTQDPNVLALIADDEASFPDTRPTSSDQGYSPTGEGPGVIRQTGAIPFGQALEAPCADENANLLDMLVNQLLSDDYEAYHLEDPNVQAMMADYEATILDSDAVQPIGPAQEHPPVGESPGPAWSPGQIGATLYGEALEASSGQAATASGGESANLFDLMVNRLMSDDCEAYHLEDPNVQAMMADYEATILDTGADLPTSPAQEHPPVGESPGPAPATGQIGATLYGEALEAPSGQASMAFGGERGKQPVEPLVDPLHAREETYARGDYVVLNAEQRQAILHIFKTDSKRSNRSLADEFGVSLSTIKRFRKKFNETGRLEPGDHANRLSAEQRLAILHIFKTEPERSTRSLVDEFGVACSTIKTLKKRFKQTGNLKPGDRAKRLSAEQRQAILHIFKTEPERSGQSLVDEFGVACSTICTLKKRFSKTGNLKPADPRKRLSAEQRRAISHIFKTDPKRNNQSLADEFDVHLKTIMTSRKQFIKTGNLERGDHSKRLSAEQRRGILHVLKTDPERGNQSIADEFGVSYSTMQILRKRFSKTGDIKLRDHGNHLGTEQRQAILNIFETDPQRSNQSLADEFGVSYTTIHILRKRFDKTGNLKRGDRANRLTGEQRRAILHIFKTDPQRSKRSLADEFCVAYTTIQQLRKRFDKTGSLELGDSAKHLAGDQRRAILHIFKTDPQRNSQSIADEFYVNLKTIQLLRKRFGKTGDIKAGDHTRRLTADQRQAILHIFKTDPKRSDLSITVEFDVACTTIQTLRKRFNRTGDVKPGDCKNRLSAEQHQAILHIFETDPKRGNRTLADEFGVSYSTIQKLRKKVTAS